MEDKDIIAGLAAELLLALKELRRLAGEVRKGNEAIKALEEKSARGNEAIMDLETKCADLETELKAVKASVTRPVTSPSLPQPNPDFAGGTAY